MRLPLISKATWVMTMLALVLSSGAAFAQAIDGYQLVSQALVSPGVREFTYRARLTNNGGPIQSATATLAGAPAFEIVDGTLTFGPIAAGGTGASTDTFVVRQRSSSRPRFTWNVVVVPESTDPGAVSFRIRPVANVRAGDPFTVVVEAVDASNNIDPTFAGNVNLNAAAVGGSNFVGGTRNEAAVAGVASFVNVVLNNAANFYQVTASAAGVTDGIGNAFNVTFTTLAVQPVANMQAGTLFNVVVEARDANGVAAENFGAASLLTLSNLQAAVPATGQVAFQAAVAPTFGAGQATFTGLAINNAANGYTFAAEATSSGVLTSDVIDAGFNVTASHLAVLALGNVRSGTAFNVTAQARDANNNVAENFAGNIDLNAAAVGGSNFVGGTQNEPSAGGVATFANRLLNNAADSYQVTASALGVTDGIGNTFNVTFTALAVLPVANMQAGTLFNVVVEARDANGVAAENFGAASLLTLSNLQAAVPATGQVAFQAAVAPTFGAGQATFTGLAINNAANGYTFAAEATSSGVLTSDVIDAGFNVTASHLAVLALGNVRSGTVFNVTAQARDANNNVAENFAGNIDLNAAAVGGSNFVGGTQNEPSAGGVATFANRLLNNAANSYQVTASAAGVTDGLSNTFNVTFTTLAVQPVANMQAGTLFNVVVEARDANGVAAENFGAASLLTLSNLQAAVPATGQVAFQAAVAPTFGAGQATFTGLAINNAANGYTFAAQATSSGGLVSDAINAGFNVTATHLVVLAVANVESGTAFNLASQARDANNSLAENFTGSIDLNAAAVGGSNFVGGTRTVAAVGGVAAFANLVLNTAANGYTVTASAAGLTSGISNAFNVTGDGGDSDAESLELELSQSVVGAGSTITITAIVRDALGDPISPSPDITFQILADEGSSGSPPAVVAGQILTSSDTRGGFVLHGTVNGTTVTGDVIFAVTPSAAQSANAGKFAALALAEGTVALKLDELTDALESGNNGAIPAINAALQAARNSIVVTGRNAIQRSRPVAPETGFLPSLDQLDAAGFAETADDVAFGLLIPQLVAKLNQIAQFYNQLPNDPDTGGVDSLTALNQLNGELAALQAQLVSLDVTPHGIVKHTTAINNLIRSTMPAHMRAVAGKIGGVLQNEGLASVGLAPAEFFAGLQPSAGETSPAAFYRQEQPAFFGMLGLFAGSSLQMNLVNRIYGPIMAQVSRMIVILAANALLEEYLNPAIMEGLITGGFLSGHSNGMPGSVIEGSGMNREDVASNEVFFIGGAAVAAVEGLIDAFNPSNIDSFDDIDDYFEGIVDALQSAGEAYDQAEQPPDSVVPGCILDGGSSPNCSELVYNSGFESVSSCSGFLCFDFTVLVLYHNKDTGHWASGVFLFFD